MKVTELPRASLGSFGSHSHLLSCIVAAQPIWGLVLDRLLTHGALLIPLKDHSTASTPSTVPHCMHYLAEH